MNSKPAIKTTLKFIVMSLIGILYFSSLWFHRTKERAFFSFIQVNIIKSALFSPGFPHWS